jgi:xanthine/CO dehydrogenase XdhC/CoxF family maturation factor
VSTRRVIEAFETWRAGGEPLVLATVVATQGSTYTKAGHRIIIAANGDYQGLVSGGCLEGDLAEHAQAVAGGAANKLVTYDMREEADELFGTGVGCNGALTILLQRLRAEDDYEPFQAIVDGHREPAGAIAAVVVGGDGNLLGATAVMLGKSIRARGIDDDTAAGLASALSAFAEHGGQNRAHFSAAGRNAEALVTRVAPLVRLLVLGAGPDALPLIRMAGELGWLVTVADHREQALEQATALADEAHCAPATQLSNHVVLDDFAAAVTMSHNLQADREYLGQLAKSSIPYVGILGPKARRDRLVDELGLTGSTFDKRLHGPVGLDLAADSPEAIALSIVAQIQGLIAERKHYHD